MDTVIKQILELQPGENLLLTGLTSEDTQDGIENLTGILVKCQSRESKQTVVLEGKLASIPVSIRIFDYYFVMGNLMVRMVYNVHDTEFELQDESDGNLFYCLRSEFHNQIDQLETDLSKIKHVQFNQKDL